MAESPQPVLVILAGPNGAGKSTIAPALLVDALAVAEFVNADVIASGLSAFQPQSVAVSAGKAMLHRLRQLAAQRADFAFESALASRSFLPWIENLQHSGYTVRLVFLSLATSDIAVERVANRVRRGGHAVPEATIRRRYDAGHRNFFRLYSPIADRWQFFDNTRPAQPLLVASGNRTRVLEVGDSAAWARIKEKFA